MKAKAIGRVQREMKIAALDCNINISALIVSGAKPQRIVDAEGRDISEYDINDKKYSSTCDYLENCKYECTNKIEDEEHNSTTYTFYDAQKRLAEKELMLKERFANDDIAYPLDFIKRTIYGDLPWEIVSRALVNILGDPTFKIIREDGFEGRLIYKNNYLLFQPTGIRAKQIPLAYRYSRVYNYLPRTSIIPVRGSTIGLNPLEKVDIVKDVPLIKATDTDPVGSFNSWMVAVNKTLSIKDKNQAIEQWNKPLIWDRPPSGNSFQIPVWGSILTHFRDIPEIKAVAARFWIDKMWRETERKDILEKIITGVIKDDHIIKALESELFNLGSIKGYKWLNVATGELEFYCFIDGSAQLCESSFKELIDRHLGNPTDTKTGTGSLFGFLVIRKEDNSVAFKTLDKSSTTRIIGAVGSDCSKSSELQAHLIRVQLIQSNILAYADADDPLRGIILGSGPADKTTKIIKNISDLTHLLVCVYMEVVLRIMDIRNYDNKRWFLSLTDAFRAKLKGR